MYTMYIFPLKDTTAVDGAWGPWEEWSTCQDNTQTRNRACNSPAPNNGGTDCEGESDDQQDCTASATSKSSLILSTAYT